MIPKLREETKSILEFFTQIRRYVLDFYRDGWSKDEIKTKLCSLVDFICDSEDMYWD